MEFTISPFLPMLPLDHSWKHKETSSFRGNQMGKKLVKDHFSKREQMLESLYDLILK